MKKSAYVYFIRCGINHGPIKIGVSKDPVTRLSIIQVSNYEKMFLIGCTEWPDREIAFWEENRLHKEYRRHRIRGEWFKGNINIQKYLGKECIEKHAMDVWNYVNNPPAPQIPGGAFKEPAERPVEEGYR